MYKKAYNKGIQVYLEKLGYWGRPEDRDTMDPFGQHKRDPFKMLQNWLPKPKLNPWLQKKAPWLNKLFGFNKQGQLAALKDLGISQPETTQDKILKSVNNPQPTVAPNQQALRNIKKKLEGNDFVVKPAKVGIKY